MKKQKIVSLLLAVSCVLGLTACGSKDNGSAAAAASTSTAASTQEAATEAKTTGTLQIAIPNDTTNEARALLLLQDLGYIKLKDGAGITATKADIAENSLQH